MGGGLREAKIGCEVDDEVDPNILYRYYALTLGANSVSRSIALPKAWKIDSLLSRPRRTEAPVLGNSVGSRRLLAEDPSSMRPFNRL